MNDTENEGQETEGQEAEPPEDPAVVLSGVSGWKPEPLHVGEEVEYYWDETNYGGKHTEPYFARVQWKMDEKVIDDVQVECEPLGKNESAHRTTKLSAPREAGIGYSIELLVDDSYYQGNTTTANSAYHSVTVDEPFGS